MRRHPSRARLAEAGERAMLHAETCERCADLLIALDDGDDERLGDELRSMLGAVLGPGLGFAERTTDATVDRIRMQEMWSLVGDTGGGVADALRILLDTARPDADESHTNQHGSD